MATKEQILTLLEQLEKAPPAAHFRNIDQNAVGIEAILKYLSETDEKVTPGKTAKHIKVSTARVAVLLKKMEAKDLIVKEPDPEDGRSSIIRLSEHGRQVVDARQEEICRSLGEMIDQIGMDRMLEFAAISNEIHSIMKSPELEL